MKFMVWVLVLNVIFWVSFGLFMTAETHKLKRLVDCHGECSQDRDCQDRCLARDYCPNHR